MQYTKASKAPDYTKNMVNTLQIISIQHELAMVTGSHIELEQMLQEFLRVCISRLKLVSAHVFLYRDRNGWPETRSNVKHDKNHPAKYFTSIPSCEGSQEWVDDKDLQRAASNIFEEHHLSIHLNEKQYHLFSIPEHGVVVFCTPLVLEKTIISALTPIFVKLAQSCNASILHESLQREMQAREQAESDLLYRSSHNETTGLPNRILIQQYIEEDTSVRLFDDTVSAVVCINLDQLHHTNDLLGHHAGDELQQWFTNFLKNNTRKEDLIGQIDTETFIVLLQNLADSEHDARQATECMVSKLIKQLKIITAHIGAHAISISISTGYTLYPNNNTEAQELISQSEIAKAYAKNNKKTSAIRFDSSMRQKVRDRLEMEAALAKAIDNDELSLWWQPQYNTEHKIIGAEALLRWKTPEEGYVSPGIFIPIAEESDLILKIGDWVLETACRQLTTLIENGIPEGFQKLSINVNARQLIGTQFVENVIATNDKYNLPRGLIAIELTESTLVKNYEETIDLITYLQKAGIDCSLDDFGTGYSSLSYLRRLPIKTIKIDQSFVRDLHLNNEDQAIARTLISLGEYLHREVIAEGVETKDELDCLVDMGCQKFQGYYFDRPMPVPELMQRWHEQEDDEINYKKA